MAIELGSNQKLEERIRDYNSGNVPIVATTEPAAAGGGGNPWDNDPAFFEWLMGRNPNMDWGALSEQEQYSLWKKYQQDTPSPVSDEIGEEDIVEEDIVEDDTPTDVTPEETDPNDPRQVGDQWMDSAGNLWASYEEAYASNVRIRQAEEERAGRVADFERRFAEYEDLMKSGKAEDIALAQRQMARMKGQLERRIESSIYGMGGEIPEGFEERLAETSTRQLLDMTSNIEQRYIAQQTAAKQFQIGTDMSLEQIGMQEQGLEQQMYQFLSTQAQREAEFESGVGMQQAELALRKQLGLGQLDLGRDQLAWQRQYGLEELDIAKAEIEGQPSWWESTLSSFGTGAGMYTAAKIGSKLIPGVQALPWCFDGSVNVIGKNGFIPMSMLKQGTRISTAKGYKPVKRVYCYNTTSTLNIDDIRVTKGHPYILNNGSLELAGNLKVGDKLWGGKAIKSIKQEKGSGRVFNIDIDGNTFHLGNATLVHTGRDKNGV